MAVELDSKRKKVWNKLEFIYGSQKAKSIFDPIVKRLDQVKEAPINGNKLWVDQTDVMLITYGDQIQEENKAPLLSLNEFLTEYAGDTLSAVHLLPFYPYSSDDGFSVIDYYKVNPELGNWDHIRQLSEQFELMFDGVINHISAQSEWFQAYLQGDEAYRNFFIEADPGKDYSKVTRPRALPLLTSFETAHGTQHIWTTFSEDQIDLNYKHEGVLLRIIELMLYYVEKGSKFIRLDAIGYMWKEDGTNCIHLKEAHAIIQLLREILDEAAPGTILITETNVPHKDNISYFGDGFNEAQMVYQFPLPPLTLHSLHTGNARTLLEWADALEPVSDQTAFFNFLASHDGIGVMPAKGILKDEEIEAMAHKVVEHGGFVSSKDNGDGTQSPYELNINYLDALSHPDDHDTLKINRFMAAQSILLAMMGMPGIYIHSLFGSRNHLEGVKETGRYRSINREKLNRVELEKELEDTHSIRSKIFNTYKAMIQIRKREKALHPNAPQKVLYLDHRVFSIVRGSIDKMDQVLCLTNVSSEKCYAIIELKSLNWENRSHLIDLISNQEISIEGGSLILKLLPYQVVWMKPSC